MYKVVSKEIRYTGTNVGESPLDSRKLTLLQLSTDPEKHVNANESCLDLHQGKMQRYRISTESIGTNQNWLIELNIAKG